MKPEERRESQERKLRQEPPRSPNLVIGPWTGSLSR